MNFPGGVISPETKRFRSTLSLALVLGTLLVLGIGCGLQDPRFGPGREFTGGFRLAAGDTSRLLRNAHYFKLMGQPDLALKEMEELHRLDPGNMKVADALAQYYDELGMGAQAQQIYQETVALAPDNPALQNNLCFSYYQAGNWSQAETCFRKTLSRHPNNQAARNNLGLVLCRQGRQEEARQLWQEAEGEAAATQKLRDALAALGMAGEIHYAQQTWPNHEEQSPPGPRLGANSVTAAAGPLPSQGSPPEDKMAMETAIRPAPPPIAVAAVKLAATLPPKQIAPDSPAREIPATKIVEDRVSPAPPVPHQTDLGLGADHRPARPLLAFSKKPAAASMSPLRETATPAKPESPTPQPVLAPQPDPNGAKARTSPAKLQANPRAPITVRELVETNIAILNGNGIQDLARVTRSQLCLEGFNVVAINNFRDFGVDRTVIYYRPGSEHVATILNNKFFPRAELEPASLLADSIDVKVVLGHDLSPQQHAEAVQTGKPKRL
jgi:hypothetical protein